MLCYVTSFVVYEHLPIEIYQKSKLWRCTACNSNSYSAKYFTANSRECNASGAEVWLPPFRLCLHPVI